MKLPVSDAAMNRMAWKLLERFVRHDGWNVPPDEPIEASLPGTKRRLIQAARALLAHRADLGHPPPNRRPPTRRTP